MLFDKKELEIIAKESADKANKETNLEVIKEDLEKIVEENKEK